MNELKNNDLNLKHSLIIEDIKRAFKRIDNHEARSFRTYLLIMSGFVVILGLEQEIKHFYIPYIVNIFLWITFNFVVTDRRFKYFAQSYLINTHYNDYVTINYENYFHNYNVIDDNKEPCIRRLWKKIQKVFHPLRLIYAFGLFISIYFAYPYVVDTCQDCNSIFLIMYVTGLGFLNLLIIGKLYVLYKHDYKKTNARVEEIHKKHLKKENSSK